ncbi:MAG: hypothetical protein Q4G69_06720 [Planctomycetia bacterium]|nr:hypothetical protein [Planctomycetia bacterium]
MIGKTFKGLLVLAVWGFIVVGIAALLPDQAWESFPRKLHPVRNFLAQKRIISSRFADKIVSDPAEVEGKEKSDPAKDPSPDPAPSFPTVDHSFDFTQSGKDGKKEQNIIPSSVPQEKKTDDPMDLIPSPEPPKPAASSVDTLPNLQFDPIVPANSDSEKKEPPAIKDPFATLIPSSPKADEPAISNSAVSGGAAPLPATPFPVPQRTIENAQIPDPGPIASTSVSAPAPVAGAIQNGNSSVVAQTSYQIFQQIHEEFQRLNDQASNESIKEIFIKMNSFLQNQGKHLAEADYRRLLADLDKLAFWVFYDRNRHILEPAYLVGVNENLAAVAQKYGITPEFLCVLNGLGIQSTDPLPPGLQMKVVRGPISGEISMGQKEMTLLFNGQYAGRFRLGYAYPARDQRGVYTISRKIPNPLYRGPLENGQTGEIAGGDAQNPLGPCWIELNNGLGLQGTNRPEYIGTESAQLGGLIFSNKDITHLNILLPEGASLRIHD